MNRKLKDPGRWSITMLILIALLWALVWELSGQSFKAPFTSYSFTGTDTTGHAHIGCISNMPVKPYDPIAKPWSTAVPAPTMNPGFTAPTNGYGYGGYMGGE